MNTPQYARCDYCGRNQHKVAIRLYPDVLRVRQNTEDDRARRARRKPLRVWPVVGVCASCATGHEQADEHWPAFGTVIYDQRRGAVRTR